MTSSGTGSCSHPSLGKLQINAPPDPAVPSPACPLCSHTVPWLAGAPLFLTDTMNQSGRSQETRLEHSAELTVAQEAAWAGR